MNSFDRALQALENNAIDEKAMRALRVCEAADDLLAALYKIDANAAESAEWIRRVTRAAIAKGEGRQGE